MVELFAQWLDEPEQTYLRRDVLAWLSKVVLPGRVPAAEVPALQDLEEFQTYLEVNMQTWTEQWKLEGRAEGVRLGRAEGVQVGRQEGVQVGRQEGEAAILLRQIRRKFGSPDDAVTGRIRSASANQLLRWAENLLDAESVDDIFVDH